MPGAARARHRHAPVLFLTARDALTDRLAGFNAGGDDYVTKPFDIEEVAARLQALLRRRTANEASLELSGVRLDPTERSGRRNDGVSVALTPTEFRLLGALAARAGKPCARIELIRSAWPYGAIVHDNTLDVYIARLRRKLRLAPRPAGDRDRPRHRLPPAVMRRPAGSAASVAAFGDRSPWRSRSPR